MGKKQKYTEDQLLEAVILYSSHYSGRIKATELARWASENIEGLAEVKDYHFTRTVRVRNPKNGKMEEQQKACTARIEEINSSRSIIAGIAENAMFSSSDPEMIFELPLSAQKKLVLDARAKYNALQAQNIRITRENKTLKTVNNDMSDKVMELDKKVSTLCRQIKIMEKQVNYILKKTDEEQRREMLAEIGINDGSIDLKKNIESLKQCQNEVFNIKRAISAYCINDQIPLESEILDDEKPTADIKKLFISSLKND